MPARVINSGDKGRSKSRVKAPAIQENAIQKEMQETLNQTTNFSVNERAHFYGGQDRLELRGSCVQRVRELQEENDHLQREISAKEKEITESGDALSLLADVEHRKVIIARNTGEILKIYTRNEERIKRIQELEAHNSRIQNEMMEMQGQFISSHNMEEKTKFASEFFILKSKIERNLQEIKELEQI